MGKLKVIANFHDRSKSSCSVEVDNAEDAWAEALMFHETSAQGALRSIYIDNPDEGTREVYAIKSHAPVFMFTTQINNENGTTL